MCILPIIKVNLEKEPGGSLLFLALDIDIDRTGDGGDLFAVSEGSGKGLHSPLLLPHIPAKGLLDVLFLEEVSMRISLHEMLVMHHRMMEGERGLHPDNDIFVDGTPHPGDGLLPVHAPGTELGDHRIVDRRYRVAHVDP